MTKWIEKNEAILNIGNLPMNFGESQAKKSMEPLNNTIHDILYGDQDDLDSYEFNESFIKNIKDTEKEESIEIADLNQLFE